MSFVILYVTHPDTKTAKHISDHLIKKRLIACVNIFPIKSSYWWKGKLVHEKEIVTLIKTTKHLKKKTEKEILNMHPYETPCIIALSVSANKSYENWLRRECNE